MFRNSFAILILLAEVWGINDDGYRADNVAVASPDEMQALNDAVLPLTDQLYLDWLGMLRSSKPMQRTHTSRSQHSSLPQKKRKMANFPSLSSFRLHPCAMVY